eukprot:TRINITY_DN6578_c1_g1_i2.p1 TRINITY_DN6578_c1_g1~~TRINITY_DN6578_c1_g1_i2.p1  ORF type:complete len:330 (+),score=52.59 TRINITY_DN6578_c1_g1_i2:222-1211(+)
MSMREGGGSSSRRWIILVGSILFLLLVWMWWTRNPTVIYTGIIHGEQLGRSVLLRDSAPSRDINCPNSTAYVDKEKDCLRNWLVGSERHVSLPWGSRRKEHMGETGVFLGDFSTSPEENTIILSAQARGGSSLVMGILQMMGITIGDTNRTESSFHHGDGDYVDACVDMAKGKKDAYRTMMKVIRKHDRASDVWAAKQVTYPFQCLTGGKPTVAEKLRNPRFIVLFRDIAGIMARQMRTDKHGATDAIDEVRPGSFSILDKFTERQVDLINGLKWLVERDFPVFFVGLSRAYKNPPGFIRDLEAFVGHRFHDSCVAREVMMGGNYLGFC